MTGQALLAKLNALSPEELSQEVLIEGEDKFRDPVFHSLDDNCIQILKIKSGKESKKGVDCICIHKW
jgi:hypothetical protein